MELARQALLVHSSYLALGNERFEANRATFIRNRDMPRVRDANLVTRITASTSADIDALFTAVGSEFAGFPHRRFDVDFMCPPLVEARLVLEGYRHSELLLMALTGRLAGAARRFDIRRVASEADWESYLRLIALDWQEWWARNSGAAANAAPPDLSPMMGAVRRSKSPPVTYWLGYNDGEPRGYCSSWAGVGGFGYVEDLFVHPDCRHRGLGTALIHHCVADCRAQGAGVVVLGADAADTPKTMYAAMGFQPVTVKREYWKATR